MSLQPSTFVAVGLVAVVPALVYSLTVVADPVVAATTVVSVVIVAGALYVFMGGLDDADHDEGHHGGGEHGNARSGGKV